MISIISPAKSMNFNVKSSTSNKSELAFLKENRTILEHCKQFSREDIKKLMDVSDKIAELNFDRFQNFDDLPSKQAFFAYDGDVYNNIDTDHFNEEQINFAQKSIRIMSGFYGIVKPLDMIKPYRLEMSISIKNFAPKGLAKFWCDKITEYLNTEISQHTDKTLINLASNEYSAAINFTSLEANIVNIHFREKRNGELKNIALNAKRARGMMVDYIIKNHIDKPEYLKKFDYSDYSFFADLSDSGNYFFVR